MIIGSLVHQLFQDIVTKKICEEADIMALINDLVSHPRVLKEFYGLNISAKEVLEDMKQFVPLIKSWNENYLKSGSNCGQIPEKNWTGKIAAVKDIEENFWSPRFGLKGKIDLTVEAEVGNTSKILPLELKTGRPSFSAEHKGQVTLYSMIMSDRRKDPQSGLLLYLKDGSMAEVPAGEKEKKALIQLRNDVVRYLAEKSSKVEGTYLMKPSFPPPLDSQRMCSRCAHLLTCTTLLKVKGDDIPTEHSMNRLIPMATGHLSESHFEYFRKWCIMLHLEISATDNESSIRSLWCQDPSQRESHGNCLSHMSLARNPEDFSNGYFLHTFHRKNIMNNSIEQLPKCFQVGESVLVSSESEIALSLGVVYNIEEKDSIALVLDKDLTIYPSMKNKKLFIDRCEYQNNMSIFFTNVSELLRDTERSEKLRRLIIDKEPPDFKEGLARKLLLDNKSILKGMNKEQQRAILRSLLSQDYAILKGYPGTGKTSTIIGLVRLLNAAGHSVLLTSYTHSAVDNILLKLKEYEDIKFLRLGKISRIRKDILPHSDEILTKNMKTLTEIEEFYDQTKIVATTCLGMGHVLFRRKTFDFCIMDEASQVLEAAALGPLFFCTRFILVGDSLQLPPVIKSQTAKELGMMKSLFERLDDENATVCLSLQYRMNEPIMNVANQLIYEGQLKCGTDELKSSTLLDLMGIPSNEIGIITPYRAQVKYMKENMPSETNNCDSCIEVNTVDQYQGRDKNVILYSCVRSGLREGKY
ncbi:DNA replication ATP-dependent helicase/nuclease DNA2 [Armadillidium vulgare]|nr:DNA replication ATP-dependent helicase/nuclease DNA2 [Armadillidium vulgare]